MVVMDRKSDLVSSLYFKEDTIKNSQHLFLLSGGKK